MFTITPEETAALANASTRAVELADAIQDKSHQLRVLDSNWRLPDDELAQRNAAMAALRNEIRTLQEERDSLNTDPLVVLHAVKAELNQKISMMLPGGNSAALLILGEEMLANLQESANGQRFAALAKGTLLTFLRACADDDIMEARADITGKRYQTLIDAGIPESVAAQILVAEASRPFPGSNGFSASKK